MATTHPMPAQASGPKQQAGPAPAGKAAQAAGTSPAGATSQGAAQGAGAETDGAANGMQALVPSTQIPEEEEESTFFGPVTRLPVELDVSLPVRGFRVRNLLALEPGKLIESQWSNGVDVPLAAGDVLLAWTEFEVLETRLAVRVTRLA